MFSTLGSIVNSIVDFFSKVSGQVGLDLMFIIGLAVEALLVIFFVVKSAVSYEASLNRCLDKINYWLFEKKNVTEDNIRDLNQLFKSKAPKRVCYYWQQYILFREGSPSEYLSVENLIEKPLKTSSYNANIKNLTLFTIFWAVLSSVFVVAQALAVNVLTTTAVVTALLLALFVCLIGLVFIVFLRARKNAILNTLYQNVGLFGRFMDNACVDLPSYIDYQILFTPQEIEKGQPVLREFLDYKARKEKEEFNKAKEEHIEYVSYDFSETGVDGSIVLDRAMRESEKFLNKREKILVQVSQLEAELESRRKNFDNVQKDSQTKIQASKENILRLRQMQEETTNRIESNYYRKQQTQEAAKQEQLEQEFEQQRAKYLLEKGECEEEIKKLNDELEQYRVGVEEAMIGEYKTFFDKFCHSAELVVEKAFGNKIQALKNENAKAQETITELEIKLKNMPEGGYQEQTTEVASAPTINSDIPAEGMYDDKGNYVYPNGTYYDANGNFHDEKGNVYSQDGQLISQSQAEPVVEENQAEAKDEKQVVDFDSFDTFDFMTDVSQKDDIYGIAEKVVNNLDENNEIEVVNAKPEQETSATVEQEIEEEPENVEPQTADFEDYSLEAEDKDEHEEVEIAPKKKAGRPRKLETTPLPPKAPGKRGRPRKEPSENQVPAEKKSVGRPKKLVINPVVASASAAKKAGRPKKIVKDVPIDEEKKGRGRPRKQIESIDEINKQLTEEEARLARMNGELNQQLEAAMSGMGSNSEAQAKRDLLVREIDKLQAEAQRAIATNDSPANIEAINARLEELLSQIKQLNS